MPCTLSTANIKFKPAFPTFSLDKRGKRCMGDAWQPSVSPSPDIEADIAIQVYNTYLNYRYFKYGNFITPNDLCHPAVLELFLRATRLLQECIDLEQHPFEAGGDNIEIIIIIRCISPNDPRISYYIVDHTHCTVKWLHNNIPKCHAMDVGERMRDCAEYWHHRSKFPVHKRCTSADRTEVITLLDGISGQDDASVSPAEMGEYRRKLDKVPSSTVLTDHQTSILAEVHSEALKHSLPAFYRRNLPFKSKLYKSLLGNLSMPRFVHNRTHGNLGTSVSQVIREHLRHPNHLDPPVRHSSVHMGDSPLGPLSPSSSNSS